MNQLKNKIFCGGNLEIVSSWPSNFISAVLTDPPYGLEFMGKEWDRGLPGIRFWKEFLRITKPGGFLFCFGGTRTYHRLACAIEDAGWEIRDCMMWLYGSGFPKSHNISKAIDKAAGAKRKRLAIAPTSRPNTDVDNQVLNWGGHGHSKLQYLTNPATDLAKLWDGYGTALKPAWEPIIVAMKPLDGTFAHNAEKHGVAGLNINGGRIGTEQITAHGRGKQGNRIFGMGEGFPAIKAGSNPHQGRWPANLLLSHHPDCWADDNGKISCHPNCPVRMLDIQKDGVSRFFYVAKTSRKERNMGMEDCKGKPVHEITGRKQGSAGQMSPYAGITGDRMVKNTHPTVKPLALIRYLCTLLKMPGSDQIILDPFLGSGTTGIACKELGIDFIGIEKEQEYCEIAIKRIGAVEGAEISLRITAEPPLPVSKNVAMVENSPHISESRQRIIDEAVRKLKSS